MQSKIPKLDITNTSTTVSSVQEPLPIDNETPVVLLVDQLSEQPSPQASTDTELSNSDCGLNSSFLSTVSNPGNDFNLNDLFNNDVLGLAITQKARDGVPLNNRDRSNICEIIISHFLNKAAKLDNQCLSKLADEIIQIIPSEKKSTYFVAPIAKRHSAYNKSQTARGKLVDKYRNKLTALRRTLNYQDLRPPSTPTAEIGEYKHRSSKSKLLCLYTFYRTFTIFS